jgi:hypothetical protein
MDSMMTLTRRLLVMALGLAACAGAAGVELVGFRGVPWGAEPDSVEPAQLVSAQGEYRCYKRERENLLWGDSPLSEVRFCFHRDRFYMAVLESKTDVDTLASDFKSMYGAPTMEAPTRVEWGNRYGAARAEISAAAPGGAATLRLTSNEFEPRELVSRARH